MRAPVSGGISVHLSETYRFHHMKAGPDSLTSMSYDLDLNQLPSSKAVENPHLQLDILKVGRCMSNAQRKVRIVISSPLFPGWQLKPHRGYEFKVLRYCIGILLLLE